MSCDAIAPLLELVPLLVDDEDDGLLEPADRAALDEHLAGCPVCRETAAALSAAYDRDAAAVEDAMHPLSPELRERVLADALKSSKPAARSPGADPAAVAALRDKIGLSCSFCHDALARDQSVFCASCLGPHHAECFAEHGRCTLPGCDETRTVRPDGGAPQAPSRGWRRLGQAAAVLLVIALPLFSAAAVRILQQGDGIGQAPGAASDGDEVVEGDPDMLDPVEIGGADEPLLLVALGSGNYTLVVEDLPLREVLDGLARRVGQNMLAGPVVADTPVVLALEDLPLDELLAELAYQTGCVVEERNGILLFELAPELTVQVTDADLRTVLEVCAARAGKQIVLGPDVAGRVSVNLEGARFAEAVGALAQSAGLHVFTASADLLVVTTRPLPDAVRTWFAPPANAPVSASRLNMDLEDVDLRDACRAIGAQVGRTIKVDEAIDERITVTLADIEWLDAVELLAKLTRCRVELRPGQVVVLTQAPPLDLRLADCPAPAVYALLGARAGFSSVVVGASVDGALSADLQGCDPRSALLALAAAYGHQLELHGETLSVSDADWAPRVIHGRVFGVDATADPVEVTLSVGSDDGVQVGDVFRVGDGDLVGEVSVQAVRRDSAVAQVVRLFGDGELVSGLLVTRGGRAPAISPDHQRIDDVLGQIQSLVAARDVEALELKQEELRALLRGELDARDEAALHGLKLQATLTGAGDGLAVVNGAVVSVGGTVEGPPGPVTVEAVAPGAVRFVLDGEPFEQRLGGR